MDRELLKEILSAVTGTVVVDFKDRKHSSTELTVYNFMAPTLLSSLRAVWDSKSLPGLLLPLTVSSVAAQSGTGPAEMFVKMEDFYDPDFNYDFRKFSGNTKCERGGETYTRPQGWYRYALKVLDKYPGGDAWLGSKGWRDHSVDGEWPVSYHGTGLMEAEGIVEEHYRTGPRDKYGRGIYSTPDPSVAEDYAKVKPFKSRNGRSYTIMLQNRINPDYRKICEKQEYWLVPIPEGTSAQEEKTTVEEAIRPYGILVKEV